MKIKQNILWMGLLVFTVVFASCKKDKDEPQPTAPTTDLVLISSAHTDAHGMEINLFAQTEFKDQYAPFYLEVKDLATQTVISHADITVLPLMDMGDMVHHAPIENPASHAQDGLFEGAVVFTMPGHWELKVVVYDPAQDRQETAVLSLEAGLSEPTRTHVVTPLNESMPIVISYIKPHDPKVGVNDFEIAIHQENEDMTFAPIENYTVAITPDMPSMGHGSPNNVNPTHSGNGHYTGQVNFTMTGMWRINLEIYDGTTPIDTISYFDITF